MKHKPTQDWKSKSTEGIRQRERERERAERVVHTTAAVCEEGGSVWDVEVIACVGMCVCEERRRRRERERVSISERERE